jgi:hypothetical protein
MTCCVSGSVSDPLTQNMHFDEIPRLLLSTLKFEQYYNSLGFMFFLLISTQLAVESPLFCLCDWLPNVQCQPACGSRKNF